MDVRFELRKHLEDFGKYAPHSATEVEIRHAWDKKKPIFFFIRDRAHQEYQQMKGNPSYEPRWIQTKEKESWFSLVRAIDDLRIANDDGRSNFIEPFSSIVEPRQRALSRQGTEIKLPEL